MITYDYPLSERVRTLLRLEDLFEKTLHFTNNDGAREHHVALMALFEILDVAGRADLKVDLVQELERQRQSLLSFRNNPEISEEALSSALHEVERASTALLAMTGKVGYRLRENEWLMSIKSRAAIPGGVCEFDLPSYHLWLHREPSVRQQDLESWVRPMLPMRDGISIVLRLLRASGRADSHLAAKGAFQLMLGGRSAQLVRVHVNSEEPFIPEISANKHMLSIRFSAPDSELRPRPVVVDVPFDLIFCNL